MKTSVIVSTIAAFVSAQSDTNESAVTNVDEVEAVEIEERVSAFNNEDLNGKCLQCIYEGFEYCSSDKKCYHPDKNSCNRVVNILDSFKGCMTTSSVSWTSSQNVCPKGSNITTDSSVTFNGLTITDDNLIGEIVEEANMGDIAK